MPNLKAVNVTFYTSDDDKRQESSIDMILNDQAGNTVARAAGSYGKFDDGSANGPFGLQVLGPVAKNGLSLGGMFILSWSPWHGPLGTTDEWHLSGMSVDLVFDDSTHVFVSPGGFQLTARIPQVQFGVP